MNNTDEPNDKVDTNVNNGNISTLDSSNSFVSSIAIKNGLIFDVGSQEKIFQYKNDNTKMIDVNGRTVIPGLNDSHIHVIRAGLNYNMELRWDGVPSLSKALDMLKDQAQKTPNPEWVRVVGGWSEYQFAEKRTPTINEIQDATGDTPALILHLYQDMILNKAGLDTLNYTNETKYPQAEVELDESQNPTGHLIARPNATILYTTLGKAPKLTLENQINSTLHFMRELNRFGVTSIIDAGGGFQNYPEDYQIIEKLAKEEKLTVRMSYNLFTQKPGEEIDDFKRWSKMVKPGDGNDFYRMNGAGELLVYSALDFEDWAEPRPELVQKMESELKEVIEFLVKVRWPWRIHATYNESISRDLDVFEEVNKKTPFNGLRWFFDHAETISEENMLRVKKLGGGIAIQDRMAFQGEHFIERYGKDAAKHAPYVKKMLELGVPVGAGTDATRVASYNPWVSLHWLVSGKTVGDTVLYDDDNKLDRISALRLYTLGSAWFSSEEDKKGSLEIGKFADMVVLSDDYFTVDEDKIKGIESVLTIVNGKVVYGTSEFSNLNPSIPEITPAWSPVKNYGGYQNNANTASMQNIKLQILQNMITHGNHKKSRSWGSCSCCMI